LTATRLSTKPADRGTGVGNIASEVVDRVTAQVAAFTHTCFMVAQYAGRGVQALVELTPGDHSKKEALCNSGAEAVENAVGSLGCTPGATQSWCSITPTTAAPT
jgi:hypothetical protein